MKANDTYGQFIGAGELRFVRTLPGPIERAWAYLTEPEKRARWLAGGSLEPRAGGKIVLHFRHIELAPDETPPPEHQQHHDSGVSMEGTITRWEPPRVLAHTFGSEGESEVTFELTPQGREVVLVVSHKARDGDLPYMSDFAAGWHTHLAHLLSQLEGTARPPYWPLHTRLKAEYEKIIASRKAS